VLHLSKDKPKDENRMDDGIIEMYYVILAPDPDKLNE